MTGQDRNTGGTTVDTTGDILRAQDWESYKGQKALKARLDLHIEAANNKKRMLDHVFLSAPPGYGKTTLAAIIADLTGHDFASLKMPLKPKVFASFLWEWEGGVLFLDEIHRGTKAQQEDLLPVLEEGFLQQSNGRRVYLPDTCIIGATTEPDKVIIPLRDRFPIAPRFAEYTDEQMGDIVAGMAARLELNFEEDECVALGRATGGTPRVARSLVLAARDLQDTGTTPTVAKVLDLADRCPDGLSGDHLAYLGVMKDMGGANVGMNILVSMLRLPEGAIRELERLLVKKHFIRYEPTGRELTTAGFQRVKKGAE